MILTRLQCDEQTRQEDYKEQNKDGCAISFQVRMKEYLYMEV